MPKGDIFHRPAKKNTLNPEMFKNIIKQRKDRRPISWNSVIKKLLQIACNVYNVSSWKRVRKCPDLINTPFGPLIKKLYRTQPVQRLRGALESFMRHRIRSITRADVPPAPQKKNEYQRKNKVVPSWTATPRRLMAAWNTKRFLLSTTQTSWLLLLCIWRCQLCQSDLSVVDPFSSLWFISKFRVGNKKGQIFGDLTFLLLYFLIDIYISWIFIDIHIFMSTPCFYSTLTFVFFKWQLTEEIRADVKTIISIIILIDTHYNRSRTYEEVKTLTTLFLLWKNKGRKRK